MKDEIIQHKEIFLIRRTARWLCFKRVAYLQHYLPEDSEWRTLSYLKQFTRTPSFTYSSAESAEAHYAKVLEQKIKRHDTDEMREDLFRSLRSEKVEVIKLLS